MSLALSAVRAKSAPAEVYKLDQITELREGKYMGVYRTLVVSLKNGEIWSFCPVLPNSAEPKEVIDLLKSYLEE